MARESRRVRNISRPGLYGRPQPVRQQRTRPEVKINLRAILAGLILIVIIGWWWRWFNIKAITVKGSQIYAASTVENAATSQLKAHWWWRNLMLVDTTAMRKQLLVTQPQLADVAISRRWPSGLNLKVTEQKPNLSWQTGDKTYLLSSEGVIVAEAGQSSLNLPVVKDSQNLPVNLGDQVAPARFVAFCLDIMNLIPKAGLQATGFEVPTTTSEVNVDTNKGYFIKFDTTRDAGTEVGDLVKVLNLLKSQNKLPSQYIDLRVDGAAYYK